MKKGIVSVRDDLQRPGHWCAQRRERVERLQLRGDLQAKRVEGGGGEDEGATE